MNWRPSGKMLLFLAQQGVSSEQVNSAMRAYREAAPQPSDTGFKAFLVRSEYLSAKNFHTLLRGAAFPADWQLSSQGQRSLAQLGLDAARATQLKQEYLLWVRERGRAVVNPEASFLRFCRYRAGVQTAISQSGVRPQHGLGNQTAEQAGRPTPGQGLQV